MIQADSWSTQPIGWVNEFWSHNLRSLCVVLAGFVILRCFMFGMRVPSKRQKCRMIGLAIMCFAAILRQLSNFDLPITWTFVFFLFGIIISAIGVSDVKDSSIQRRTYHGRRKEDNEDRPG